MPDLSLEMAAGGRVAGVDEAGRGPLAGPVVAAAVLLDAARLPAELADGLDDSKRLSAPVRDRFFALLLGTAAIGLGAASVTEIDRLNVLTATMLAMRRAVVALAMQTSGPPDLALVDGDRAPDLPCPARTVIGGDGVSLSIAAASVAAKVTRDRLMCRLAVRYPDFGWDRNAGYGTAGHRDAIMAAGITPHHRTTFAPVANLLNPRNY